MNKLKLQLLVEVIRLGQKQDPSVHYVHRVHFKQKHKYQLKVKDQHVDLETVIIRS